MTEIGIRESERSEARSEKRGSRSEKRAATRSEKLNKCTCVVFYAIQVVDEEDNFKHIHPCLPLLWRIILVSSRGVQHHPRPSAYLSAALDVTAHLHALDMA